MTNPKSIVVLDGLQKEEGLEIIEKRDITRKAHETSESGDNNDKEEMTESERSTTIISVIACTHSMPMRTKHLLKRS